MTPEAVLAIALQCLPPALAPIALATAQHENRLLDPLAVTHNANGTSDYGLAQINAVNFGWLSVALGKLITPQTILDPCTNLQASMRVLFVRYNGNPADNLKVKYSDGALAAFAKAHSAREPPDPPDLFIHPAQSGRDLIFTAN